MKNIPKFSWKFAICLKNFGNVRRLISCFSLRRQPGRMIELQLHTPLSWSHSVCAACQDIDILGSFHVYFSSSSSSSFFLILLDFFLELPGIQTMLMTTDPFRDQCSVMSSSRRKPRIVVMFALELCGCCTGWQSWPPTSRAVFPIASSRPRPRGKMPRDESIGRADHWIDSFRMTTSDVVSEE